MRLAYSEYHNEVIKPALSWLSRHWRGYTILVIVVYTIMFAGWYFLWHSEEICKFFKGIKERFTKKEAA